VGPFGVMGGFMQPQAHVQVVCSAIDFRLNPQEILDAPRWRCQGGKSVFLERGVDPEIARKLSERGHEVTVLETDVSSMGRGQVIWRTSNGAYCAGTEPRADGAIACF